VLTDELSISFRDTPPFYLFPERGTLLTERLFSQLAKFDHSVADDGEALALKEKPRIWRRACTAGDYLTLACKEAVLRPKARTTARSRTF
jgi:hypothetical protein